MMHVMVATSQRPIVNRILACEPLTVRGRTYTSIEAAIGDLGKGLTAAVLVQALNDHGIEVSDDTLYRWRRQP